MKKIIDLYRKYGLSTAKLRDLAIEMEKFGRAEKRKDNNNIWADDHNSGKEVWYLDEKVVLEYLAGELASISKKNKSNQQLEDLEAKIQKFQARENDLLAQITLLTDNVEKHKKYALVWKEKAKELRNKLLFAQTQQNKNLQVFNYLSQLGISYEIFYDTIEKISYPISYHSLLSFVYVSSALFHCIKVWYAISFLTYNFVLEWCEAFSLYIAIILVVALRDSFKISTNILWAWLNFSYRIYFYCVEWLFSQILIVWEKNKADVPYNRKE